MPETPLHRIVTDIITELSAVSTIRDRTLQHTRLLTRTCAHSIRALHRHDQATAERLLAEARDQATRIRQDTQPYVFLATAGYTQDALKELVEASLLMAFVTQSAIPSPQDLQVPHATYLGGLAEAATELRRYILDLLREDRVAEAEPFLAIMDEIYDLLNMVDLPAALTNGLRRKADVLRSTLERTRSDLTTAIRQAQMRHSLDTVRSLLSVQPDPE